MVGKNSDLKIGKRRKAVTHGHFEAKKNPYVLDTSERIAGALYIHIYDCPKLHRTPSRGTANKDLDLNAERYMYAHI